MKYSLSFLFLCFALCAIAQTKHTLYIVDRTVECATGDCLQIKEKKKAAWVATADTIEGLKYEEGYEYKVKTLLSDYTHKHKLLKVISKKKTGYNPAVKLEGKKWVLTNMFDNNTNLGIKDSTVFILINVTDGKVSGHGVCNNMHGTVRAEGHNITFGPLASTRMSCLDQGNTMEAIINNLLSASTAFELKGKTLTLYSATKGSSMTWERY